MFACVKLSFVVGVTPDGKLSNEKIISPSVSSDPMVALFKPSIPEPMSILSIAGKGTSIGFCVLNPVMLLKLTFENSDFVVVT